MELKASVKDLNLAADRIAAVPTCSAIDRGGIEGENVLRFRFSGNDEALAALLAGLHDAGVRPVTFREIPLSLEDAYLAISGQVPGGGGEESETVDLSGAAVPAEGSR